MARSHIKRHNHFLELLREEQRKLIREINAYTRKIADSSPNFVKTIPVLTLKPARDLMLEKDIHLTLANLNLSPIVVCEPTSPRRQEQVESPAETSNRSSTISEDDAAILSAKTHHRSSPREDDSGDETDDTVIDATLSSMARRNSAEDNQVKVTKWTTLVNENKRVKRAIFLFFFINLYGFFRSYRLLLLKQIRLHHSRQSLSRKRKLR